ncbi:DUF4760 domain-containing protein [Legionella sp. 29fVS95]|uniref:DUF4760 domain-containing protein n=1 Tax=Legionella sp. 29fVS95 TaxID=3402813 RepID=UPI003AF712E1
MASTEIVEAREVIHLLYLDAREMKPRTREQMRLIIGEGILCLHSNRNKIPEFIRLLNFLDFLETIGYLYDSNAITLIEIRELLGNSMIYYFEIFKPFIVFRREDTDDKKFYENFEKLYNKIKNYPEKKCWFSRSLK